jgi:predicted permease
MTVSLSGQTSFAGPSRIAFYDELFRQIGAVPGVEAASAINHLPLAGDQWGRGLWIEGRPLPPPGKGSGATYRVCRPKYFSTRGIALLQGRDFSDQDGPNSPDVTIINETFARLHFAGENPIGKRITMDDVTTTAKPEWLTIVGVVKDAKKGAWTEDRSEEFYLPWLQTSDYVKETAGYLAYMTLVIRTATRPRAVLTGVQNAIWGLNKNAPISNVTTMEDVTANAVWQQRFNLVLIAIFAGLALVLAGVGIYGVMAYTAAQRTQEIGIRMALGAQRGDVLALILRQGIVLAASGIGIGLAGAISLSRMLQALLYSVSPNDPLTLAAVSAVLGFVAFVACWFPARRAMQVDPMVALRNE